MPVGTFSHVAVQMMLNLQKRARMANQNREILDQSAQGLCVKIPPTLVTLNPKGSECLHLDRGI